MKEIPLTQGEFALVDDADYPLVSQYKWFANRTRRWYVSAVVDGRQVYLHRFLMNPPVGMVIDHIDGDGLNNTRANIRICTDTQNKQNRIKTAKGKSPYKGVFPVKNRWQAFLQSNGERVNLGCFSTPEEAARAYNQGAIREFGEFARLNDV